MTYQSIDHRDADIELRFLRLRLAPEESRDKQGESSVTGTDCRVRIESKDHTDVRDENRSPIEDHWLATISTKQ